MQQLIDKQVLLQALKRKRYSKQSLDLIESLPEVPAIDLGYLILYRNAANGEERRFLLKLIETWSKEHETNRY